MRASVGSHVLLLEHVFLIPIAFLRVFVKLNGELKRLVAPFAAAIDFQTWCKEESLAPHQTQSFIVL